MKEDITIYDVAERAGVSTSTVSRVVNGSGRVKAITRARVEEAIEALGYRLSHAVQELSQRRGRTAREREEAAVSFEAGGFEEEEEGKGLQERRVYFKGEDWLEEERQRIERACQGEADSFRAKRTHLRKPWS